MSKRITVKKIVRLRRQRSMHRDDIGALQQLVKTYRLRSALTDLLRRKVRVVGKYLATKTCARDPGKPCSDIADTNDAKRLPRKIAAHKLQTRSRPTVTQRTIRHTDMPLHRNHHADHMLGNRLCVAACLVYCQNPRLGTRRQVKDIYPRAARRDHQQLGCLIQKISADTK